METKKILCKKCDRLLDTKYFYFRRNEFGKVKYIPRCKACYGVKNPDKVRTTLPPEEKPKKKEVSSFINEMEIKGGSFDFVDSLRLVDIFTRQFGIINTSFTVEEELMYMWEKMKEVNRKK